MVRYDSFRGKESRISRVERLLQKKFFNNNYTHVVFHRGYTDTTIKFKIGDITIGEGRPEWGAEPNKNYFKIYLCKEHNKKDIIRVK